MTPEQTNIIKSIKYDPDTGLFYWRLSGKKRILNKPIGHIGHDRYCRIMLNYKMYSAATLAWFLYYREWPPILVDHIDRNPSNNCINNLRLSNHSLNGFNVGHVRNNKTGYKGVTRTKTGKYQAARGRKFLGVFNTAEEAAAARKEADNAHANY